MSSAPKLQPFSPSDRNRDHESYASILIDQWYSDIGLWQGIPAARLARLACLLNVTPYDLGRLLCIYDATKGGVQPNGKLFSQIMRSGTIPPSIALNVAVMEAWHGKEILGMTTKPVIPLHLLKTP